MVVLYRARMALVSTGEVALYRGDCWYGRPSQYAITQSNSASYPYGNRQMMSAVCKWVTEVGYNDRLREKFVSIPP